MSKIYEYMTDYQPWQRTMDMSPTAVAITAALREFQQFPKSVKPISATGFLAHSHDGRWITVFVREVIA